MEGSSKLSQLGHQEGACLGMLHVPLGFTRRVLVSRLNPQVLGLIFSAQGSRIRTDLGQRCSLFLFRVYVPEECPAISCVVRVLELLLFVLSLLLLALLSLLV